MTNDGHEHDGVVKSDVVEDGDREEDDELLSTDVIAISSSGGTRHVSDYSSKMKKCKVLLFFVAIDISALQIC